MAGGSSAATALKGLARCQGLAAAAALRALGGAVFSQRRAFGFGSHVSDNDPEVIEREKERNLRDDEDVPEVMPDVPGWNERLASDSEAVVKAEHVGDMTVEEMQVHTVKIVQELCSEEEQEGGAGGQATPCASDIPANPS